VSFDLYDTSKFEMFERAPVLYCGIQRHKRGASFFGSVQPGLQECGSVTL
jgi:hypothetical protein